MEEGGEAYRLTTFGHCTKTPNILNFFFDLAGIEPIYRLSH